MKSGLIWILCLSLCANGVLLARRVLDPSTRARDGSARVEHGGDAPSAAPSGGAAGNEVPAGSSSARGDVWRSIESADLRTLAANLRAAGFNEDAVKAVVRARIDARFRSRSEALHAARNQQPYWRQDPFGLSREQRAELRQMDKERRETYRDIMGEDLRFPDTSVSGVSRYGPLPAERIDAIRRIEADYAELSSQHYMESGAGPQMPWEREKVAYLESERRKDIEAALTPEELEIYDLHASATATNLRRKLAGFDATEAEFRALYAIEVEQKGSSSTSSSMSYTNGRLQMPAERRERVKAALGEARYADFERVTDLGFQGARDIVTRLGLPAGNATAVYQLSKDFTRRADEMRSSTTTMDPAERRAAAAALAQDANRQLESLLTADGLKTYKSSGGGGWLRAVESQGGIR